MRKNIVIIITILLIGSLVNARTIDILTVKNVDFDLRIKNVNIVIPKLDTTLVIDAAGVVELHDFQNLDILIKEFGYKNRF